MCLLWPPAERDDLQDVSLSERLAPADVPDKLNPSTRETAAGT